MGRRAAASTIRLRIVLWRQYGLAERRLRARCEFRRRQQLCHEIDGRTARGYEGRQPKGLAFRIGDPLVIGVEARAHKALAPFQRIQDPNDDIAAFIAAGLQSGKARGSAASRSADSWTSWAMPTPTPWRNGSRAKALSEDTRRAETARLSSFGELNPRRF